MPTELTDAIRDALRAEQISAVDLRQPVLRERTRRRPRAFRVLAATVSAAVVVAIALVLSIMESGQHGTPPAAPGGDAVAGIVGYRWDVIGVQDEHGTISVPKSLGAEVGFTRDGHVFGDDTVNALQGRYRATPGGYRVQHGGTTYVGYAGTDPIRQRVIAAVDGLFLAYAATPDSIPTPVTVAVHLDGDRLSLRHGATTVILTRAGRQPDALTSSPSSTATPTVPASVGASTGGVRFALHPAATAS